MPPSPIFSGDGSTVDACTVTGRTVAIGSTVTEPSMQPMLVAQGWRRCEDWCWGIRVHEADDSRAAGAGMAVECNQSTRHPSICWLRIRYSPDPSRPAEEAG